MTAPVYKRILLKLSGEALAGDAKSGLDAVMLARIAAEVEATCQLGVQVGMVIGGGNIFRGLAGATSGMNRSTADGMGMLATVINCLAMRDAITRLGRKAAVLSAVPTGSWTEVFSEQRANALLAADNVVLFAAGTGNPYFTTDTAAALRALEIRADVMLKGTKVDGVYDKDPALHKDASRFSEITYDEVLSRELRVLDLTATVLCRDNGLPLHVFDMTRTGNIGRVVLGEPIGSRVVKASEVNG